MDPTSPFETHLLEDVVLTTLDNLAPSTEYEVRVRVENAVGRSDPSVTMRAKTKVDGELNFQVVCRGSLEDILPWSTDNRQHLLDYNEIVCIDTQT